MNLEPIIEDLLPCQQFKVKHHKETRTAGYHIAAFVSVNCKHCGQLWIAKDAFSIGRFIDDFEEHIKQSCRREGRKSWLEH